MSGATSFPTVGLWVQFGKGPYDGDAGSTAWTQLTLKKASIRSGRTVELEATPAGQGVFLLDNNDRKLDPFNTAGPYAGNLLPGREVRLATGASADGSVGTIWTGFAEEWPQTYSPPKTADVELPCVDALGLVATSTLPTSVYTDAVKASSPMAWFRFNETTGFLASDSSGNRHHGQFNNGISESVPGLLAGDVDKAVAFLPDIHVMRANHGSLSTIAADGTWQARSYEFWWKGRPRTALVSEFPLISVGRGGPADFEILYNDDLGLSVRTISSTTETVFPINPLLRHHIVVTRSAAGTRAVYVDGVPVTTTNFVRTPAARKALSGLQVSGGGYTPASTDSAVYQPSLVTFDEVAVYPTVLSAATVAAHYAAGATAWAGDNTLQRLTNVTNFMNLGSLTTTATMSTSWKQWAYGPATLDMAPLEYLQALEASEQGRLVSTFDAVNGTSLAMLPREAYEGTLPIVAAFTDDPAGTLHYDEIELDTGASRVRNSITIAYASGKDADGNYGATGEVTVASAASIVANGRKEWKLTTVLGSHTDAQSLAEYLLDRYATPRARVTKLVINPAADSRLWTVAKTLKIGDRVTVRLLPQNTGSAITVDCRIDGLEHDIDGGVNMWRTTYYLSAIDRMTSGTNPAWWIWGGPATWGSTDMRWYL